MLPASHDPMYESIALLIAMLLGYVLGYVNARHDARVKDAQNRFSGRQKKPSDTSSNWKD